MRLIPLLALAAGLALAAAPLAAAPNRVFYAGASGAERFHDVHALSDGTLLVAGGAADLDWLPPGTPRIELPADGIDSASAGRIGFILQLSADLSSVLRVLHFPPGSVRDVFKLRSTEVPGDPTGSIYLSGNRDSANGGYYLARLDGNFVHSLPAALLFAYNVRASGDHASRQPWDVGGDGAVVHAIGRPFDTEWAAIEKIDASGQRVVVEHWHAHWRDAGEWDGTPASSYPDAATQPLRHSAIVMKAQRRGSLRSPSQAEFDLIGSDANGNGGRKGRFPDDYYHAGPCLLQGSGTCPNTGPGYTGYRANSYRTQRVGGIAIDRRSNRLYFGYSTQTVLPGGNPDFEPAIVAMAPDGELLWWDRLYRETNANSPPDQYVDGLAIDYANDRLLVVARTHGNAPDNFWRGDQIALAPGSAGFQQQFTGTNGNIHLSWLGAFRLDDGRVQAATYVAEFVEGSTTYGAPHPDPLLDGWPNPNAGWPDLNTTRCGSNAGYSGEIEVGPEGEVALLCLGRRTLTTRDAHQTMPRPNVPDPLAGSWNQFVRVYAPDLAGLRYSSLLTGAWDTGTGSGGDNTALVGLALRADGVIVAGLHEATAGIADGEPVPVAEVPAWGEALPQGESALLARLSGERLGGEPAPDPMRIFRDGFEPMAPEAP